ncbi:Fidgetin-like protein 1 [Rhypophila decipiens]|uniref:Fidgetin-like protein 1 n=1 Tax=Rhypophila decipiens TaxID=261697 RepID=A0AAN6YAF0_9PEZI|nr:Fidgetin-like protein 1 [Rhypophila decipiens]
MDTPHGNPMMAPALLSGPKAVEYTISQDRSAGHSAQVEEGYALLAGPASNAQAPALQDYEMQLRLLESQNKKRLMMARQGQEINQPDPSLLAGHLPAASSAAALQDYQMQLMLLEQQNKKRQMMARQEQQINQPDPFHNSANDTNSVDGSNDGDSDTPDTNEDGQIASAATSVLEREDATTPSLEHLRPELCCILYRVSCPGRPHQCDRKTYQDEPQRVPISIPDGHRSSFMEDHLAGKQPVKDLRAFLSTAPKTAFIVYRDFQCQAGPASPTSVLGINSSLNESTVFRERISVVSEDLQGILQKTSLFAPDRAAYKMPIPWQHQNGHSMPMGHTDPSYPWSAAPSEYTHRFLFLHRQVLRDQAASCTEESRGPLEALLSYLDTNPHPMYAKCDAFFARGVVTQDTLEWLFCPNEVLVSTEDSVRTGCVLRCFPDTDGARLGLLCWSWGYDGHRLRRKDRNLSVQIPSFGETRIDQLAVYPLRFAPQEIKDKILANGRKFWQHRKQMQIAYQGPDYQRERTYPRGSRFMLDYQVYSKFHGASPAFSFSTTQLAPFDPWPENIPCDQDHELSETEMMLLPAGIHGFYFKEKKWMHLLVQNIQPTDWNKMAYEQLVLPKRTKNLVKALVMVRKQAREESDESQEAGLAEILKKDDLIAGKGNGLIMLLHGGPGTGKTLTAGNVAELAEMPLYSVTCGDIGTKPEAVEKYLNTVLYLGKKWNCVLLLDEADVFLEQRSLSDLDRNSLVSVFLRTLEYYDGVLILTSNRVSTFDEAFKSRIQLALHYPALDMPGRRKIWTNFLDMLEDQTHPSSTMADGMAKKRWSEKVNVEDIKAHMDELAGYELNGRQIRNALTTARQLSLFEESVLDWEGLKGAIDVAGDFTRYLEGVNRDLDDRELGHGHGHGAETGSAASGSWVSTGTFR